MNEFILHVIGSGSALSMHGRHPSAQVVQYGSFYILIDCGEGTQDRLKAAGVKAFKIENILISHLHGDHVFGLPGLLGSLSHLKRTKALTIYGPIGLKALLESIISLTSMKLSYPLHIVESAPESIMPIWENGSLEILTFPLNHRVPCNGYLLREIRPKTRFRKEQIESFGLSPEQIKAVGRGEDIIVRGEVLSASTFTFPAEDPMSYAYCSDTRYDKRIIPWISKVSVLYHEATFMHDKSELADETGHSTAQQAAEMARLAKVSCLITGHYSSRYKDLLPLITEAREVFAHVLMAEEGKKYNLKSLVDKGIA